MRQRCHHVLWIPLTLLTWVSAQEKPADAPAPIVTAQVRELLKSAERTANEADAAKAIDEADGALTIAQRLGDAVGEAHALQLRTTLLVKLNRNDEALIAASHAERLWKRLEDGPGQIEAIGTQAVLEIKRSGAGAAELLQRAITVSAAETKRPRAAALRLLTLGDALAGISQLAPARSVLEGALKQLERAGPAPNDLTWALRSLGSVAATQGDLKTARRMFERALQIAESMQSTPAELAACLNSVALVARQEGDLSAARAYLERALKLQQGVAAQSVPVAQFLVNLGAVVSEQGDLPAARAFYEHALGIFNAIAPNSLGLAMTLNNLGVVAGNQGDLDASTTYHQRALVIRQQLAPKSLDVALSLHNLGSNAQARGDFGPAREYHLQSLAIREALAPNSLAVANSFDRLGLVSHYTGDLQAAYEFHRKAFDVRHRLAPQSLATADSLNNLGSLARDQGDLLAARDYFERSLAIREARAPHSLDVARGLNNLGSVAQELGDPTRARDFLERAAAIREKLAPNSLDYARSLSNLATLALERGDLPAARHSVERALAIRQSLAPYSPALADSLADLGRINRAERQFDAAYGLFTRAIEIQRSLAPTSLNLARMLSDAADIDHVRGDLTTALDRTDQAWKIVGAQGALITGDEARQAFGFRYQGIAAQLIRYQIAAGKIDEAFATFEQSRAQALLRLLAERGIASRLAPSELWTRFQQAHATSDRLGKALELAGTEEGKARDALNAEIAQQSGAGVLDEKRRLLTAREQQTEEARRLHTRSRLEAEQLWAAVRTSIERAIPPPVHPTETRRALPPNTVLTAFVVGEEVVTLFVVRRDGPVQAFVLPIPSKELSARVQFVRRTVTGGADERALKAVDSDDVRITAARDLYQKLFPPVVRRAIRLADRILLSPDGILWDLPFAALVANTEGEPQYLGLEKPLAYTQSLATFAQTTRAPRSAETRKRDVLVAGNPLFVRTIGTSREREGVNAGNAAGEQPRPLPFAQSEAEQIGALYRVKPATGSEPTEAWFRRKAVGADIIHLATHGYFNPFRAVSSTVRLAASNGDSRRDNTDDDGALQAWEVFGLQLRAQLVVLSACETGVGSKVPGEGLIGLTRAFQVAGAATIVATQWNVLDRSTATGMVAFHKHVLKGIPRDESLQRAMQALAGDPATAHPRYWSPFVLIGDVRPLH